MLPTQGYAAFDAKTALRPFAFQRREPGERDVLIRIQYCGVCHTDIHQARDEWASSTYPMVPGHEIVGTVERVGAAVTRFAAGDLAGVGSSLPDAATLVAGVFAGACAWWAIMCTAAVGLRQHFTGKGILWLNRATGAVILAFGVVALISLLPLPWRHIARSLDL